jgi:hypothetical protein
VSLPEDQLQELKAISPALDVGTQGGRDYVVLPGFLRAGSPPRAIDLLLCPHERDGYPSRLFLSEKISGRPGLNWNSEARILDRNWFAFSFRVPHSDLRLAQLLGAHLRALR